MKETYYRQCKLRKNYKDGSYSEQISYIPEPYCVYKKVLKLKDEKGNWDDGWKVTFVSENRVEDKFLPDSHSEIKNHRKATGDSDKK